MRKLVFMAFLCLSACFTHKEIKIDPYAPKFEMQESNRLFFKNVRTPYYNREELSEGKVEVFSMPSDTDSLPNFRVKLVLHLVAGRAFAMLEPAGGLADTVLVHWQDTTAQQSGTYRFQSTYTPPDQYAFATKLYGSIQHRHLLQIETAEGRKQLWPTTESREPFRKAMVDFYRLVGIL